MEQLILAGLIGLLLARFFITLVIVFPLVLILMLFLRWRRVKSEQSGLSVARTAFIALALAIALDWIVRPQLSFGWLQFQRAVFFLKGPSETYHYASIADVKKSIDANRASVSFNLIVTQGGKYLINGEIPCYKRILPATQVFDGFYQSNEITFVANQPNNINFVFISDNSQSASCPKEEVVFAFILKPHSGTNDFGKDYFVTFSGSLERWKESFNNQRNGYPVIYIKDFSLKKR